MASEPLHPFLHTLSYVHTLGHAAEIASRVEGCGVALDLVHTFWDRRIDDDIAACVRLVSTVHVGNLSKTALDAKTWRRSQLDDGGSRREVDPSPCTRPGTGASTSSRWSDLVVDRRVPGRGPVRRRVVRPHSGDA
jgi:sugar phosphate isomerase/epimerase